MIRAGTCCALGIWDCGQDSPSRSRAATATGEERAIGVPCPPCATRAGCGRSWSFCRGLLALGACRAYDIIVLRFSASIRAFHARWLPDALPCFRGPHAGSLSSARYNPPSGPCLILLSIFCFLDASLWLSVVERRPHHGGTAAVCDYPPLSCPAHASPPS